jgi:hypothetical protein
VRRSRDGDQIACAHALGQKVDIPGHGLDDERDELADRVGVALEGLPYVVAYKGHIKDIG